MRSRLLHLAAAAAFLALGVAIVLYAGPGRAFVRGALGDVISVVFLVHVVGTFWPRHAGVRILGVLGLAWMVECVQLLKLVGPDSPDWLHLTLGSTFDPWDLLGYTVGAAICVATEAAVRALRRRTAPPAS